MKQATPRPPGTGPPRDEPELPVLYQDTITHWINGVLADCEQHGIHGVSIILNVDHGYRHAWSAVSPIRGRMMAALGKAGLDLLRRFYHDPPDGSC